MKKILLAMLLCCIVYLGVGQVSNPYNQKGVDYAKSLAILSADIKAGRIKDFNTEAIGISRGKIPLKVQGDADLAARIVKTMKAPGFDFSKYVSESSLSPVSKQFINDLFYVKPGIGLQQYQQLLEEKNAVFLKQDIPAPEKELLLSLSAIAYHHANELLQRPKSAGSERSNCYMYGPDGSGPVSCAAAGALIGGIVGFHICGVLCGLGGAIVGGIVGSFT